MDQTINALPVAKLDEVLLQYQEAARPLLSDGAFEALERDCGCFYRGEGSVLQKRLERYAAELQGKSWLREYSRQRFLSLRTPLTIVGNFTLELHGQAWMKTAGLSKNGAALAWAAGRLYQALEAGAVPVPEGNDAAILDEQMRQVLGCARIPQHGTDDYIKYSPEKCRHFGVFYRNHYYTVRLFQDDGALLAPKDICASLAEILNGAQTAIPVNFHTAAFAGSERCSDFLSQLSADSEYREQLSKVNHALFHLALFDCPREGLPFEKLLFTNTENIYPYKPWSFMLFSDGAFAVNNEHTSADGVTNVHLYQYVMRFMEEAAAQAEDGGRAEARELIFRFTPEQTKFLAEIRSGYEARVRNYCVDEWRRTEIDWARWKELGIGRDALIQLGFLFASRALYQESRCIHESVSTAHYYQGRTSCLRPLTSEMKKAADSLCSGMPAEAKLADLLAAGKAHSRGIRRAKSNVCFVRHGAGLMLMQRLYGEELGIPELPALLRSDTYRRFCTQEISTSTVGGSALVEIFGFSPQVRDGLGIGYLPEHSALKLTISSDQQRLPDSAAFGKALHEYYDILAQLLKKLR